MWTPKPERAAQTGMARFMGLAGKKSYDELHAWSVAERGAFWNLLWEFCEVKGQKGARALVDGDRMPGALWFPDARLNFAENLLRSRDHRDAIVFWGEDRVKRRLSHRNLYDLVSRLSQALADAGVKKGDRVAGCLPNLPEATAAMLATASLGAVWSSCSPDFGVQGVLDRFGQIQPKVLFCADGYFYGGKEFDSQEKAAQVLEKLPSVEECVVIDYLGAPATAGTSLYDFLDPFDAGEIHFEPLEFNHPLCIVYSSGTTGVPKGMVHGTGGTLLQHLKEHRLHSGLKPRETHRLEKLRAVLSTGSPLLPEGFDYVYRNIKDDVCLSSISGGTDIVSCFVLGNPAGPVWRGEIQAKGLGMAVEVFDENGRSVSNQKGELVCTKPFPSMPVGFWNDPDGAKYRAAYFDKYPNVWRHGDWCEATPHGGIIIYGRSDAVLNPGGVRIGTAEIYRQVEQLDEIVESLVIGQDWAGDVRVVLFVKLREGRALDDSLVDAIKRRVRENTTPRHVPAKILQVEDIPRTKSGKIVELAG